MAETLDLGPLTMTCEGDTCRFTLTAPEQMMLDVPPQYDRRLSEQLADVFAAGSESAIVMDLQGLPAISSRQLGVMLALQKAQRVRGDRLTVAGASRSVQHLLKVTRTEQFFTLI